MVEEHPDFAFYSRDLFNKSFIPSQYVKGSNSELVIIHLDESIIEISRTSRFSDPLVVRLNGEAIDIVEHNEKKEISFQNSTGNHLVSVWNARAKNFVFSNFISKKGLAITIDNVPVQNTMADPIKNLDEGKIAIWGLVGLISLKIIISFVLNSLAESSPIAFIVVLPYLPVLILLLYSGFVYAKNPRRAVLFGLVLGGLETIDFIAGIVLNHSVGGTVLFFLLLRTSCLFALFRTLKTINKLLAPKEALEKVPALHQELFQNPLRDQVPLQDQEILEEPKKIKAKKEKKYLYSFINAILKRKRVIKYSLITLMGIIFLAVGSYLLIQYISRPNLERDSSIAFRSDLKLPDLIPYRKGDKWGYCDKNKNIVITPQYKQVQFVYHKTDRLVVNSNGLKGAIDLNGNKLIPFIYDNLSYYSEHNIYIARRGLYGVINDHNEIIIPFNYDYLICSNDCISASYSPGDLHYEGLFNYDGTVRFPFIFDDLNILKNGNYLVSYSKTDYLQSGYKLHHVIYGIIDKSRNEILPMKYDLLPFVKSNLLRIRAIDLNYAYLTDYKFGVADLSGKLLIPFLYDDINLFESDSCYFLVKLNNKCGIVDKHNATIVPFNNYSQLRIHRIRYFIFIFSYSK